MLPAEPLAFFRIGSLGIRPLIHQKDVLYCQLEYLCDPVGQSQGRVVLALFKEDDGLAPDASVVGEILLCEPVASAELLKPGPHQNVP